MSARRRQLVELEQKILRAILVADLQQYTRLIAADESDTLDYVSHCLQLLQEHCEPFCAEFVKTTGDGVLILFDSASSAVDYAMSVQERMKVLKPHLSDAIPPNPGGCSGRIVIAPVLCYSVEEF